MCAKTWLQFIAGTMIHLFNYSHHVIAKRPSQLRSHRLSGHIIYFGRVTPGLCNCFFLTRKEVKSSTGTCCATRDTVDLRNLYRHRRLVWDNQRTCQVRIRMRSRLLCHLTALA